MPSLDDAPIVWEGQAEFLEEEEADIVALLTGAGYGKTKILVDKCIRNVARQDNWHLNRPGAHLDHLKFIYAAPHDKYLTERSIPAMKAACDLFEGLTGRRLRATTGRSRDGYFGGGTKRQEFRNGVDVLYYPLYDASSAVSVDAGGVFVDEATLLTHPDVWLRLQQRLRDPRAKFHQTCIVGTPEEDHFIRDLLADEEGNAMPGVKIINGSSVENPMLPMSWFEQMGQQASPAYIKAQVHGGWVAGMGGQRFAEVLKPEMIGNMAGLTPLNTAHKFYLGWDPGYATGAVVVLYYYAPHRQWWVFDEVAITGQTTQQTCDALIAKGYNRNNVLGIGVDIDARKLRSSAVNATYTDYNVIRENFGQTPQFLHNQHAFNRELRLRLDVIDTLMSDGRLVFNKALEKKSRTALGVINSIRKFALKKIEGTDLFEDKPTPETLRLWKHFIDAIHYALVHFDKATYERLHRRRGPRRRKKG